MYGAVSEIGRQNQTIYAGNQALTNGFSRLNANRADIGKYSELADKETGGTTTDKNQKREMLTESLLGNAGCLYAFASSSSNAILQEKVKVTESALDRMRENELAVFASEVIGLMRENLPSLAEYEITETDITQLEILLTDFKSKQPAPRVVVAGRQAARDVLKGLFQRTDKLLKDELDKMMLKYISKAPEFYAAYQSARVIVDRGVRYRSQPEESASGTAEA
jgi:hypothetical protein